MYESFLWFCGNQYEGKPTKAVYLVSSPLWPTVFSVTLCSWILLVLSWSPDLCLTEMCCVVALRYRLQTVKSLAGVSLMLRLLWASLRWDDMAVKPSAAVGTTRTGRLFPFQNSNFLLSSFKKRKPEKNPLKDYNSLISLNCKKKGVDIKFKMLILLFEYCFRTIRNGNHHHRNHKAPWRGTLRDSLRVLHPQNHLPFGGAWYSKR